jgi:hypothetical protein
VYQSRDGGQSWQDIGAGLAATGISQVLFSPAHAQDGTLYLVPAGPGLFKRVGDGVWSTSSEAATPPTTAPLPTATVTPRPAATTVPAPCAAEPVRFAAVWQQTRARLGCLLGPVAPITLAEQPFEHGRMIWDSSNRQIYVLLDAGTWQAFQDTFEEGVDPAYDPNLPPPPRQPQRGFGKVWRGELGGPQAAIGWAQEGERAVDGWRQEFDGGLLVWTDATTPGPLGPGEPGTVYLLYEDGTWEAFPAPVP